jgi:hypothetical protein
MRLQIRLFLELLYKVTICSGEELPVNITNCITGHIRPMLRELDRKSVIW